MSWWQKRDVMYDYFVHQFLGSDCVLRFVSVSVGGNIMIRNVNLLLFGGISLFFFWAFGFFFKWFSAFLKKSPKEKNTGLRHRHYWESSKSFGKQSLTSLFASLRFFHFRSKFKSVASTLGTIAGCRLTRRRRWCLNSRLFWSLTCYLLPREGGREGGRLEGITWIVNWPVYFNHREGMCGVSSLYLYVSGLRVLLSPLPSHPKLYYIHPSLQNTHA